MKINLTCKTRPSEIFECFVDREVIDLIVSETNKFAAKYIHEKRTGGKMHGKSRDLMWTDTNPGEMRVVIALIILQRIVKKPNIDDYHSMHPLLHTPIFGKIISRDKLKLILKYLHFSDLEKTDDALYKIRKLIELLVSKFRTNYVPEKNISVDESLMLWKGRLRWKRYIPLKRSRFGIESFILAESETGYVWNMNIYTGKGTEYPHTVSNIQGTVTKPSNIVLSLVEPLLNQGYCVGMDNYYTSPELYEILLENRTDAVGTVRFNRKNLSTVVSKKKLKKEESIHQFKRKMMHMKWKDKNDVNMLSTTYEPNMERAKVAGKETMKPTVCINYKRHHMAGVDIMDQITSCASPVRKSVKKYYKKIFFRLVEISIQNARCIYKRNGGT